MDTLKINKNIYNCIDVIHYNDYAYSKVYRHNQTIVIIDHNICDISHGMFEYSQITISQNKYMHDYQRVYRFIDDGTLSEKEISDAMQDHLDYNGNNHRNRDYVLDNSVLEHKFEEKFAELYGYDALEKLTKEFAIVDDGGHIYNLDYYIENKKEKLAVEENGVTYHHPQIIGIKKYKRQLHKQNTCASNDIKLYRFSTEDLKFEDKMNETIHYCFDGILPDAYIQSIKALREFKLYTHQENILEDIRIRRQQGLKTSLVVLPTASGKSKIIEEDLKVYATSSSRVLVLVPTIDLVNDWKHRFENELSFVDSTIETFSLMNRHYHQIDRDYFDYIIIDEAHHAMAPTIKRTIQYFTPDFMIGLTATDERLDQQKLQDVFGEYETHLTLNQAMEQGIIAKANVYRLETNINLSKVRFNGKEYSNNDLEKTIRVTSRNELIGDVITTYFNNNEMKQKQGLIFCVNVAHAKEVSALLKRLNITSEAYVSNQKNCETIMRDFKDKKIRFLCVCNKLNEGWDYPELGILIMARPTMSKVLYTQQIGRGLRKAKGKDHVYIIDVVDEYGAMLKPWSMHSLFQNANYVPFGNIVERHYQVGDMAIVDGLCERIESIKQLDITTFEEQHKGYINQKQLAIECFVSNNTIIKWLKKGDIQADTIVPFGNKKIYLFSKENVQNIFKMKNIQPHTDETIKDDFMNFVKQNDFTFSFKMIFVLSMLKHVDYNGEVEIEDVLKDYTYFYQDRLNKNLQIDREHCRLNNDTLNDHLYMKRNLLNNPFEKYERKRFIYYSKELNKLSFSLALWNKLTKQDILDIKRIVHRQLNDYYQTMDGVQDISYLEGEIYE